jgi:hypothetical protein
MSVSISAAANPTSKEITTLTEVDPFTDVADTAEDQGFDAPPPEAPKKVPAKKGVGASAVDMDGVEIVMTFKEGSGFDASWNVVHAKSVEQADALLDERYAALLAKQKKVAAYFRVGNGGQPVAARPAPAAAATPPAGAPECPPGWEFKSGTNKNTGKPWKGFFPPRGDDTKPIFFN